MAQLRKNIIANFAGQGWAALMQLVFIPVYIKFLGIEAYGLIGFYAVLQGILQILDLGLSPTMTRELARYSASAEKYNESRTFVRTLETIYWCIGLVIGVAIFFAAPFIADQWLHATALSSATVRTAIQLVGLIAALQWPLSFYQGGLFGLQRLVLLNAIKIGNSTVFACGAALVVIFLSRSIVAFFAWQALVSALNVGVVTFSLWRSLPASAKPPRFDRAILRQVGGFAGGMTGVMITGILLSQIDKVILSKLLPLNEFGYYSLAYVLSNGLILVILPVTNALFPRFSVLVAAHDEHELSRLYHLGCQFTAVILFPIAALLALFSHDVLWLWTGNPETSRNTFEIARFLVIGMALNGLMYPISALQQAKGWTSIGIYMNILLIALIIPAILLLLPVYGALGAALAWMSVNMLYVALNVPSTHRRILKGEGTRWIRKDIGFVLLSVLVVTGCVHFVVTGSLHSLSGLLTMCGVASLMFFAALVAASELRPIAFSYLGKWLHPRT